MSGSVAQSQPTSGISTVIFTPTGGNVTKCPQLATTISWAGSGLYNLSIAVTNVFLTFSLRSTYIGPASYKDTSDALFEFLPSLAPGTGGWPRSGQALQNYSYTVDDDYNGYLTLTFPNLTKAMPGLTFSLSFTPLNPS
jgi:hypothetical protein